MEQGISIPDEMTVDQLNPDPLDSKEMLTRKLNDAIKKISRASVQARKLEDRAYKAEFALSEAKKNLKTMQDKILADTPPPQKDPLT